MPGKSLGIGTFRPSVPVTSHSSQCAIHSLPAIQFRRCVALSTGSCGFLPGAETAMVAANMGRNRERMLRLGWEGVKDDIMREALRAKFTQHPALQALLLATGDAELVEHTTNDRYWADGGDGGGRNRLGQ